MEVFPLCGKKLSYKEVTLYVVHTSCINILHTRKKKGFYWKILISFSHETASEKSFVLLMLFTIVIFFYTYIKEQCYSIRVHMPRLCTVDYCLAMITIFSSFDGVTAKKRSRIKVLRKFYFCSLHK